MDNNNNSTTIDSNKIKALQDMAFRAAELKAKQAKQDDEQPQLEPNIDQGLYKEENAIVLSTDPVDKVLAGLNLPNDILEQLANICNGNISSAQLTAEFLEQIPPANRYIAAQFFNNSFQLLGIVPSKDDPVTLQVCLLGIYNSVMKETPDKLKAVLDYGYKINTQYLIDVKNDIGPLLMSINNAHDAMKGTVPELTNFKTYLNQRFNSDLKGRIDSGFNDASIIWDKRIQELIKHVSHATPEIHKVFESMVDEFKDDVNRESRKVFAELKKDVEDYHKKVFDISFKWMIALFFGGILAGGVLFFAGVHVAKHFWS